MLEINDEKILWSVRECAAKLGISERTLFKTSFPRGNLKSIKIGSRVFYSPEIVKAWIKNQENE